MKISRTHSSFTLPTDAPACVKDAIDAFGFLVKRNSELTLNEFAKLITDHSSHPRAKYIADELSSIDPEPQDAVLIIGGTPYSTESPSIASSMRRIMKTKVIGESKKFIFNAFTAEDIIEHINQELKKAGRRVRADKFLKCQDSMVLMRTKTGKSLVAILWSPQNHSLLGFRGIHQVRNHHSNYTYMFNGQPGKHLKELIFNGEEGQLYSTNKEQLTEFYTQMYRNTDNIEEQVAKRIGWCAETNPELLKAA